MGLSSSRNDQVVDEVEAELSVKRVVDVIEKLSLDWSDVLPKSVHIHSIARLAELVANRAYDLRTSKCEHYRHAQITSRSLFF